MNDEQLLRYSRHILLPQIDIEGQQNILESRILVVGLGGLGSPVSQYLAASGVGELVLVDDDLVDLTNLQRQIVHDESSVGKNKAQSAAESALALNSTIKVTHLSQRLDATSLQEQIRDARVVVDCTDNLSTRLLINRTCWQEETPLVSGAAIGFEGQLLVVDPAQQSACYRCLYDENSDTELNCSESGVFSPLVGVIGSMQALEALKIAAGLPCHPGKLTIYDAIASRWQTLALPKLSDCPVCSNS